jgi:putative SOS response-associated peptidase YedK
MCSNYETVTRADRLLAFFGVVRKGEEPPVVTWPTGLAPFVRLAEDGSGNRRVDDGAFGLLPTFAKELAYGRRTYNAKSETVAKLPSFRNAWRLGQRCIVPAEAIFEPFYETAESKPVRWRIQQPGEVPFGIAGIWEKWIDTESGVEMFSFAMLTVSAEGHPVMSRFHKWGEEKRMVIFLDPHEYDDWLTCPVQEAPKYFRQWLGRMETSPAPLPPRAKKAKPAAPPPPAEPLADPTLF